MLITGTKFNGQSDSSGVPLGLTGVIKTIPWMMTQHVQQVCEQYQTGWVSDTVEGRAARQRDRPKKNDLLEYLWSPTRAVIPHLGPPLSPTCWDQLSAGNFCGERHGGPGRQRVEQESAIMTRCTWKAADTILPFLLELVRQHHVHFWAPQHLSWHSGARDRRGEVKRKEFFLPQEEKASGRAFCGLHLSP